MNQSCLFHIEIQWCQRMMIVGYTQVHTIMLLIGIMAIRWYQSTYMRNFVTIINYCFHQEIEIVIQRYKPIYTIFFEFLLLQNQTYNLSKCSNYHLFCLVCVPNYGNFSILRAKENKIKTSVWIKFTFFISWSLFLGVVLSCQAVIESIKLSSSKWRHSIS